MDIKTFNYTNVKLYNVHGDVALHFIYVYTMECRGRAV